jgi:hypothetical protein
VLNKAWIGDQHGVCLDSKVKTMVRAGCIP